MAGPFHHAFRTNYKGVVNALVTECAIAAPQAVDPSTNKKFSPFKAVWDTGATNSVITQNVVRTAALAPTGMVETRGVHGAKQVNTYIVDIVLPNRVCIPNVRVSEGVLMGNIDILIGMDIIQIGDFNISNANGKTIFSFCIPAHFNPVDLLEKSNKVNQRNKSVPTQFI